MHQAKDVGHRLAFTAPAIPKQNRRHCLYCKQEDAGMGEIQPKGNKPSFDPDNTYLEIEIIIF